jgi:hypothetical protein
MSGRIPPDLATPTAGSVSLTSECRAVFEETEVIVQEDLALEHLGSRTKDALWRLVCEAELRQSDGTLVSQFVDRHDREPTAQTYLFTVLYMSINEPFTVADVEFLPRGAQQVAEFEELLSDPDMCAIARCTGTGTDQQKTAQRARERAERALRILRVAATGQGHERQLKFGLGERFAVREFPRHPGWRLGPDKAWPITFPPATVEKLLAQPIAQLGQGGASKFELRATTALEWLDRARFTDTPVDRILYQFFALEAILGDKSEGEKGSKIAFRRAMLDHLLTGSFINPSITLALYADVRSVAVHGGDVPSIEASAAKARNRDVWSAINQTLDLAGRIGATSREQLCQHLDHHEEAHQLLRFLREIDPTRWDDANPIRQDRGNLQSP